LKKESTKRKGGVKKGRTEALRIATREKTFKEKASSSWLLRLRVEEDKEGKNRKKLVE